MKFNPFRPNNMVAPGMFSGRAEEIRAIEQSLFQAKNGNPHHFLIQGERGIGKSSLFFYVQIIASGDYPTIDHTSLKFLTVSIDINGCSTQSDIVRSIGRALRSAMADKEVFKARATQVWDFLKNWEVLGVSYHSESADKDIDETRDNLVAKIADLCERLKDDIDGVLLLIDEADSPGESAGLGEFVKLFTERLTRRNCNNVLIGMAGLPSIIPILKASHESSARIFEIHDLQPLEPVEREHVIRRALASAATKNERPTEITKDALHLLCELSEGYPHFLQQFGFCAFAADTDDLIDVEDVKSGAFKENGALAQLGNKYFNGMYYAVFSENYRRVLDAMATHSDSWVSRHDIVAASGVSESNVNNALAALKEKKTILQDETRRGFYRLPTKSFAAWINVISAAKEKQWIDLLAGLTDSK